MEAPKVIYWFILDEGTEWEESSYAEDEEPTSSLVSHVTPFVPKSEYDAVVKEAMKSAKALAEFGEVLDSVIERKGLATIKEGSEYRQTQEDAQRFLAEHKEDTK